jgi:hypothetical protein
MELEKSGLWPNLKYYSGICLRVKGRSTEFSVRIVDVRAKV